MVRRKINIHNSYFAVFFACLVALLVFPSVALAHSQLLGSNPAAGAVLDAPPSQIDITFSEGVGLQFSTIKLYDRTRAELALGPPAHVGGDDTTMAVGVPTTLRPGIYTVVWRIVSGVDGHVTAGTFAFRVRDAATKGTPQAEEAVVPLPPEGGAPLE